MSQDEDHDLTRQDEDIDAAHFAAEEMRDAHDFGNWPELIGLAVAAAVIWYSFSFTG
ncbi:hypothetical protein [Roseovarius indicus]|uniref:Uncharacterized protein n=1 Tax=Roseovarius indicus TaxID=540747 RepID=A0A5P3A8N7_9RHOB|nr:hypothetical protein [Roseovarius indicus]QEW25053.1 hypothetical protein RIdsm_00837 [Roseovarius indicus]SFE39200.1 hypothetical protein SAMN04488031_10961 [Roseovarius indicus]